MFRYVSMIVCSALLCLTTAAIPEANAQFPRSRTSSLWATNNLAGTYVNQTNGRRSFVQNDGNTFLFTNENGTPAWFVFDGPSRLVQVRGGWDPSVSATVQYDPRGRIVLRFDSPNSPPGFWTRVY